MSAVMGVGTTNAAPVSYLGYFAARGDVPDVEDLLEVALDEFSECDDEELYEHAESMFEHKIIDLTIKPIAAVWRPPKRESMMSTMGATAGDVARFEAATHAVSLDGVAFACPGFPGQRIARIVARLVAREADALLCDPLMARFVPPLEKIGRTRFVLTDHILAPRSYGAGGRGLVTTFGMTKFGIPNLSISDIPPRLVEATPLLALAIADSLTDLLLTGVIELRDLLAQGHLLETFYVPVPHAVDARYAVRAQGRSYAHLPERTLDVLYRDTGEFMVLEVRPPEGVGRDEWLTDAVSLVQSAAGGN